MPPRKRKAQRQVALRQSQQVIINLFKAKRKKRQRAKKVKLIKKLQALVPEEDPVKLYKSYLRHTAMVNFDKTLQVQKDQLAVDRAALRAAPAPAPVYMPMPYPPAGPMPYPSAGPSAAPSRFAAPTAGPNPFAVALRPAARPVASAPPLDDDDDDDPDANPVQNTIKQLSSVKLSKATLYNLFEYMGDIEIPEDERTELNKLSRDDLIKSLNVKNPQFIPRLMDAKDKARGATKSKIGILKAAEKVGIRRQDLNISKFEAERRAEKDRRVAELEAAERARTAAAEAAEREQRRAALLAANKELAAKLGAKYALPPGSDPPPKLVIDKTVKAKKFAPRLGQKEIDDMAQRAMHAKEVGIIPEAYEILWQQARAANPSVQHSDLRGKYQSMPADQKEQINKDFLDAQPPAQDPIAQFIAPTQGLAPGQPPPAPPLAGLGAPKQDTSASNRGGLPRSERTDPEGARGLTNYEIDAIVDHIDNPYLNKIYAGVVRQKDIPKVRISLKHPMGLVVHVPDGTMTDSPSPLESGHYIGVYIEPTYKGQTRNSLEVFDSFGQEPSPQLLAALMRSLSKVSTQLFTLKSNALSRQSVTSQNCGYFVVNWLLKRSQMQGPGAFAKSTGFDKFVRQAKSAGVDILEEDQINKFKRKFVQI